MPQLAGKKPVRPQSVLVQPELESGRSASKYSALRAWIFKS
jgi:hypothetical protein